MNNVEWTILGLLADARRTGYDVLRLFKTSPSVPWRSSSGSVYPALKTLVREGLATAAKSRPAPGRRGAVTYEITRAGRAAVRRWLETPVAGVVPEATTETLVRLLFAHHAPPGATRRMLERYRQTVSATLAEVETASRDCPEGCPPHQKACLLNGKVTLEAQLGWVDETLEILNQPRTRGSR